jgi:hypothetical protein
MLKGYSRSGFQFTPRCLQKSVIPSRCGCSGGIRTTRKEENITGPAGLHFFLPVLVNYSFTDSAVNKPTELPAAEFPRGAAAFYFGWTFFFGAQQGFKPPSRFFFNATKNRICRSA